MNERHHKITVIYLAIVFLILTGFPRLNIKVGPAPLYIIDVFIAIVFIRSQNYKIIHRSFLNNYVLGILALVVISEILAMFFLPSVLESVYMLIRTSLAISLFFSVQRILRTFEDLETLLRYGFVGLSLTAVIMILSSLPMTRLLVMPLFNASFLEPAELKGFSDAFDDSHAMRGRSLIGVSILSAAFLNAIWPLTLMKPKEDSLFQSTFRILVSLLMPVAVVMSYSRGAIIGLALVTVSTLFYATKQLRSIITYSVLIGTLLFSFVGWESDLFMFWKIENKTVQMIEDPTATETDRERLFAYIEPWQHLWENPQYLYFGRGLSTEKVQKESNTGIKVGSNGENAANHAVFAQAYYSYGLIAALLYMFLFFSALNTTFNYCNKQVSNTFSKTLLPGLLGLLPWFVLGHAAVSQPRGAMLFFFLMGLVAIQKNLNEAIEVQIPNQTIQEGTNKLIRE